MEMYRKGIDALQKGIAVEVTYGHGKGIKHTCDV